VRLVAETTYQAGSWDRARRVVYKAKALDQGPNTRFVVTTRTDEPAALYEFSVDRGEMEGWIKDYKRACIADRLSDHRFWANQFRLFLHAAAYWLLDTLRRWLQTRGHPALQLDTRRLRLLKVGAACGKRRRACACTWPPVTPASRSGSSWPWPAPAEHNPDPRAGPVPRRVVPCRPAPGGGPTSAPNRAPGAAYEADHSTKPPPPRRSRQPGDDALQAATSHPVAPLSTLPRVLLHNSG
jgi:hypothetical protein